MPNDLGEVTQESKIASTKKVSWKGLLTFVVGLLVLGIFKVIFPSSATPEVKAPITVHEILEGNVASMKKGLVLPSRVDDKTTLVDITAEGDAVRYHYALTGVEPGSITDDALRASLLPAFCSVATANAKLLNMGARFEYEVSMENSETHLITFVKSDCSK